MKAGVLKDLLKAYPDDMHVVVALAESQNRGKVEIKQLQVDPHGVLNLVTSDRADVFNPVAVPQQK